MIGTWLLQLSTFWSVLSAATTRSAFPASQRLVTVNGDNFFFFPLFFRYLISPSEVADLHLISYEVERDLIPLILSNCQYSMEKGGETLQHVDLERIQQQVISKFLQGKPLITLTVGQGS